MATRHHVFLSTLIVFALVNLLFLERGPWMDEAMLLSNFDGLSFVDLFRPFPLYDQAAPPGHSAIALVIAKIFGPDALYFGLRIVSLVAMACIAALVLGTFLNRNSPYFGFIFVCLLMSCTMLMMQAVTIKHYVLDAFVSTAVLAAGVRVQRRDGPVDWAILIFVALLGFTLSFISIVPVMAVVFALGWDRLANGAAIRSRAVLTSVVVLVGLAALFLVYKAVLLDPITRYQLAAYPEVYERHIGGVGGIVGSLEVIWNMMGFAVSNRLLDEIDASKGLWATRLVLLALFVMVLRFGLRIGNETSFVARVAISAILAVLVLNVAGKLPVPYERHLSFYQPIVLTLVALLLSAWAAHAARRGLLLIVLAAIAVDGVIFTMLRRFDDVPGAASYLASDVAPAADAAIWVSFPAQPAFLVDERSKDRLLGLFDPASGVPNWTIRGGGRVPDQEEDDVVVSGAYPDQMLADIAGETKVWLVISHNWRLKAEPFIVAAAADGWTCKEREEPAFSGVRLFLCEK